MGSIRPGAVAGALAVGVVVAVDPAGWYPFGPAKWWVVSTLTLLALASHLWRARGLAIDRRVAAAGALLLGWLTVAALLGREDRYAWYGTPERHLGLVAFGLFAVGAVVGAGLDERDRTSLVRGLVVAGFICGAYALVELWVGPPVATTAVTDRLGGSFGSAAYLAAALCLLLPVAAAVALDQDWGRSWRAVAAAATVAGAIAFVGTGTRGAWAAVAGVVAVAVFARRPDRRVVAAGALTMLVAVAVLAGRSADVIRRSTPLDSRWDEWSMASRAIADRPLFGVGPEGYRTVVGSVLDAAYERSYGRAVVPDRAHSGPLDVAVIGGFPAAVLWLVVLGFVAVGAWRVLRAAQSPVEVGVAVAVLAYGTQQLVLFPLADLDPLFWLLAGTLVAAPAGPVLPVGPARGAAAAAALVAVALFVAGTVDLAADRVANDAVEQGSLERAERAVELRPNVVRYRLLVAAISMGRGSLADVDRAIEAATGALAVSPHDPVARTARAAGLLQRARITGDPADVEAAAHAWQAVVEADPNCHDCRLARGSSAALGGDVALARLSFEAAVLLARAGDDRATAALAALDRVAP